MAFWKRLTIERLAAIVLFLLLFAMAVRVPVDSDTWWHLRSGETIVEQRAIPRTDSFSHTRAGAEWLDHGWGAQVILYGLYELFGGTTAPGDPGAIGLTLYTAGLALAGLALVYRMCSGNAYLRAFVLALAASAAAVFWSPRPQMFSFVLSAAVLYLLHLYKRRQIDRLWLIPPLMALWVNLHGGFAIGFILLLGTLAGEVIANLVDRDAPDVIAWPRLRKLALITLLALAAVALNPYGVRMLAYPFQTVGIGVLQDFIQEWGSPDFHQIETWPFAALLLAVLAAAALSTRRMDWSDLVLVTGTALMSLMAGRNIALFAVVAAPVLTRHADHWLTEQGWQLQPTREVRGPLLLLNWLLLAVIGAGVLVKVVAVLNTDTVRDAQEMLLPVEVGMLLDDSPPPGLMFNSYNWGGYLMFAAPDVPVYVDGRTDLYDDEFLRDYLDIAFVHEGWRERLDEQQIGFVVIEAESTLAMMLRQEPGWQETRLDAGRSSVFVRRESGS
ncbi:MAG: hypothetical protein GXY36_04795 [Chloroflexi bacterium]|nr:hypothetical protein [Chloroflexota bacterium]